MSQDPKVVSTEVIHCNQWGDEGVQAIIIVFEDGTVEVRCEGHCTPCRYGNPVA